MGLIKTIKNKFLKKQTDRDIVFAIYNDLVRQARNPDLYKNFDIPDTLDGRFEVIVLHLAVFLVGTKEALNGAGKGELGRDLNLVFLKDMDRSLREVGVGDLSVGKQVKKMASAHHGRLKSYEAALVGKDSQVQLAAALQRNLYRGENISKPKLRGLADYSFSIYAKYNTMTAAQILNV